MPMVMRRAAWSILVLIAAFSCLRGASADCPPVPRELDPNWAGFNTNLSVRDMDIQVVFQMLSATTGRHFQVPPDLHYKVSFEIRDVPASRAGELVTASQNLEVHQVPGGIVVSRSRPKEGK